MADGSSRSEKQDCHGYDTKLHLIMRLQPRRLKNVENPLISITLRSTLTRKDNKQSKKSWWP